MPRDREGQFLEAMARAGWVGNQDTGGFCKGTLWVSYDQALAAWEGALAGQAVEVEPQSETLARTKLVAANDQAANDG
jgi:hypothetical protein